jgi:hypothetical protein
MKEYQRKYYLKNKYTRKQGKWKNKTENMKEYQREYYLRNKDRISSIRAEYYINKVKERNKNKIMLL